MYTSATLTILLNTVTIFFYINSIVLSWPRINQCQIIYCPLMQSTACSRGLGLSMPKKKKMDLLLHY